jgi:NADH-quinone oxidoreductase subunit L
MIARLSPIFEYSEVALNVILIIGALTCLLMGLVGIVQNDIKRIIAYSTLSQLGYMMTAMGVSAYPIGIFHLTTHAFFKALLFLGAGSVILMMHHEQNIWKMGNLKKYMPITYLTMLIGSLALIGFPLLSGFYSKDLIIEAVKLSTLPAASFAYIIVLGSVFITALYTFRLFFVVFHGKERFNKTIILHLRESPAVIWLSLILLAVPSLIAGALLIGPLFEKYFGGSIFILDQHKAYETLNNEFKGPLLMAQQGLLSIPFGLAIAGIVSAWLCYIQYPKMSSFFQNRLRVLNQVLQNKFGFDIFYQWLFAAGARSIGRFFWIFGDQLIIDGVGVNGSAEGIGRLSLMGKKFQSGFLYHYAFTMIVGFLFLVIWLIVLD